MFPANSDHGTHVAGTIAGYAETAEGEVLFSGVAPDAQILAMKVFPDSTDAGANEGVILAALEDALLLGADVVNLSLGSDNGWAEDDTAANHAYERMNAAGLTFMVSAGNSGDSTYNNQYGSHTLTADPETSMMSAPAVYSTGLAVASIENTITSQSVLYWQDTDGTETKAAFADPNTIAMKSSLGGASFNVIPVDGYGTYDDYYNAGFRNYYGYGETGEVGVALVKRGGGISFADKINAATQFSWSYYDSSKGYYVTEFPVKAVIVYDEDPDATELIYMSVENAMLTSCFINGRDGHALFSAASEACANGEYVTLRVSQIDEVVESATANQMSSFSSWGADSALELKPEITAPGGNIWSAIIDTNYVPSDYSGAYDDYTGGYGMMSGTSMAAPHMSGIALLVRQAVMDQYGLTAKTAVADLSEHLLVSTALPQRDKNGVYYSPRYQGAGLVNAAAAISTPAYISVEGMQIGKLELKDDPQRTGSYDLTFQINNIAGRDVTYSVCATLMRPNTDVFESVWGEVDVTLTLSVGQTATVNATLTPEPTLEQHTKVLWESYAPGVATVDPETGLITAVSEGYAYLRAYTNVEQSLETVCIVHVVPCVHANTTTVTVDATCTADGSTTVTCNDCGHIVSQEPLPGGHDYKAVVTEPTCVDAGFTTYTCSICSDTYAADEAPALGHSYEHITVAPGCGETGYDQHICTVCGYTYVDSFTDALECPSAAFLDVAQNDWYHEAVDYVVAAGLMNGMDETHFGPAATTNRAQVVTVLYRLAGSLAVEGDSPFTDVPADAWFHGAVLWAYQNGIAKGMSATTFGPGLEINRAQLVTFLYRFAAPEGEVDTTVLARFPDGASLPEFARDSFAWAISGGLIDGMDGMLNASGTANRAQLATVLMRFDSLSK